MWIKDKIHKDGNRYASPMKRLSANMLDMIVFATLLYILGYILNSFMPSIPSEIIDKIQLKLEIDESEKQILSSYGKIILWIEFCKLMLISVIVITTWHKWGCTPGKKIFGLVIIHAETFEMPSLSQCVKRYISLPLSIIPLCMGIIWSIFDCKCQTFHDKISKTAVVYQKDL